MITLAIVLAIVGLGAGFGVNETINRKRSGAAADQSKKELEKAKKEAAKITEEAKEEANKILDEARREEQNRRKEFKDLEVRLVQREESLDKKLDDIDKRSERLRGSESEVETLKDEIRDIRKKQQDKLEKIAKLTKSDAADKLMQMTERDIREDLTGLISKLQNEAKEQAEDQAALIIPSAMER
ncbi:MAG TPA: Rnase Y domain-containing protein, partial [Rhabdochlamydiaceae bacterium]